MGSPLSGTLAELYLQRIENDYIKQWIDSEEIYYYKRYVDDIIILFNKNKIQEEQILHDINCKLFYYKIQLFVQILLYK